ncbi:MAG: hypothetical protein FH758_12765 [Firmicutes bacterium]|nr:hypothetical protein [Bacillota bacterium]
MAGDRSQNIEELDSAYLKYSECPNKGVIHISKDKDCCTIACPKCGYEIKDIKELRCPRCFASLLPAMSCSGNCKKCGSKKK